MIVSVLGWFGAILYLLNHGYLAFQKGQESTLYYWLNLVAATALVVSSVALFSWQPVLTNAFWVGVSALALFRGSRQQAPSEGRFAAGFFVWPIGLALTAGLLVATSRHYLGMEIVGWAGTALFCAAYWMFATGTIERPRFLIYNAVAALALSPILFLDQNWPVFFLEIVWALTSIVGWRQVRATAGRTD